MTMHLLMNKTPSVSESITVIYPLQDVCEITVNAFVESTDRVKRCKAYEKCATKELLQLLKLSQLSSRP